MNDREASSPQQQSPENVEAQASRQSTVKLIHLFIRNSPWFSIALLIHILGFAIISVMVVAHKGPAEKVEVTAVSIAETPLVLPDAIEEPPEIIDRSSVPILPDQQEGPVNPDPNYIPDAAPGRAGEITDEIDPTKEAGIYNPDPEALSNLPSGATGGTPIGVGSVGHHGTGTPSAYASRRAGGGGKGGGGLGQGGGGGPGGARVTVDKALLWLQRHQSADGGWDADNFSQQCKKNTCSGPGNPINDAGLTGLALLCYLGAGHTHETGPFKNTVREGLKYLMQKQEEGQDGCFGEMVGQHFIYNHACAALAMAEAYGMTEAKPFKDPAQKGINFVLKAQNPYSAWRYSYPPDGDNDSSVTGWMVMVLKSGKMSNLLIDPQAIENASLFIDEITDPSTGRTGYTQLGESPSRMPAFMSTFPPSKSESLTAVGMLVRIFAGHTLESDAMIDKGAELLVRKLPVWEPDTGAIDFYYWYYGTLAMHQVGGARWEKWNKALESAIIATQRVKEDEDEFGSWDPVDPWSSEGGRIYATTLNCLSMEVYYRYPRVFGTTDRESKGKPK
jgi:squalene-hopene cyclase-like protein